MIQILGILIWLICAYYLITYALSPRRGPTERWVYLGIFAGSFFIPYGWLVVLIVGALCWGDARSPH